MNGEGEGEGAKYFDLGDHAPCFDLPRWGGDRGTGQVFSLSFCHLLFLRLLFLGGCHGRVGREGHASDDVPVSVASLLTPRPRRHYKTTSSSLPTLPVFGKSSAVSTPCSPFPVVFSNDMEGGSRSTVQHQRYRHGGGGGGGGPVAAPFVLKTYRMVDDPSTDAVIAWGCDNNSFVVIDPFAFSQSLLPSHFKHSNFSSFVRQLNTYVRTISRRACICSMTRSIVRRNSGCGKKKKKKEGGEEEEEDEEEEERVAAEVVWLKQEQRRIDETVQGMWRRVQETERRPRQMLAFLVKVAGDPKLLHRLGGPAAATDAIEAGEKRARLRSGGDERMLETEEGCGGCSFDGQVMAEGDGEEFLGTVDSVGLYGGPAWVGSEYGGMEVDVGVGSAAAYPFSFHLDAGF
ncbi:hypothetical protein BHE74_00058531 [Ensete ventricosum]|nr:hypothetical protein BHE74_00058531 [Ensete ventricosum]